MALLGGEGNLGDGTSLKGVGHACVALGIKAGSLPLLHFLAAIR